MAISRKAKLISLSAILLIGSAVAVQAIWRPFAGFGSVKTNQLTLDLAVPDVVIETRSLARIPADMLKVPLLKDVLTEDFVFYYEQNESRLSLSGALRRIAYEHHLAISDTLLTEVLNEPAEVAMWRDESGKLRYWLLKIKRNGWAKWMQAVANVSVSDSQLRKVAELPTDQGDQPVYALDYGFDKTLLFVSKGDELLVLSDPGMLIGQTLPEAGASTPSLVSLDKDRQQFLSALMSEDGDGRLFYRRYFQLPASSTTDHQIAVSADFLSFGYQSLFAGFEAVRFDFGQGKWQSAIKLDTTKLPSDGWKPELLWRAIPANPALCSSLPLHAPSVEKVLNELAPDEKETERQAFVQSLRGQTAVCWYAKSTMGSPLFIANLNNPAAARQAAPMLGRLFEQMIGASEPENGAKFPVKIHKTKQATIWQRIVSARYGVAKASRLGKAEGKLSAERYFPVALAVAGDKVVFSPDRQLVDDVIAVSARQYPSAGDLLKAADQPVVLSTPKQFALLLQNETLAGLPADQEPVLREVAMSQLLPRLKTLSKYPPLTIGIGKPTVGNGWVMANWLFQPAK